MSTGFGWDIGGAHLKAARCDRPDGRGLTWRLQPFAIWREPAALAEKLATLARDLGAGAGAVHALTMTAELSDVFPDRATGVRCILDAARAALPGRVVVLDVEGAFVGAGVAVADPERVAAANWLATASLAAAMLSDGILIDTGSTTTDIVPLVGRRPAPRARHDTGRLACGELVYTGALRTPPAAIASRVPLGAGFCRTAPEYFTQMADAYLLLGRIDAAAYTAETPDGRGRSREECAARLARLVAAAPADLEPGDLERIAAWLEERQVEQIAAAVLEVAARMERPANAIVAGAGAWLAAAAAQRAGLQPIRLADAVPLAADAGAWDVAAPAVALALRIAGEPT